ncbi:hypothetical protein ACVWW2_006626 [Bradyrhizobium sp. LM4.3]
MRSANSAQHALPGCAKDFMLECGPVCFAEESGHLREPGRRVLAYGSQQRCSIGSTAALVQRSDQRKKGLMSAEQLVAATVQHAQSLLVHPVERHLQEGGFSDPGFAGDEDDLTLSGTSELQRLVQRLECASAAHPPVPASIDDLLRDGSRLLFGWPLDRRQFGGRDRRNEAIAAPRDRLDVVGGLPVVAEHRAQRVHGNGEARLADVQIGPDRVEQLFLGDELTGPTDKIAKNLERLRRQRDPLPASPQ